MTNGDGGFDGGDGLASVIAHGVINTLSVVTNAAGVLRSSWPDLSDERRDELIAMIDDQARTAMTSLAGLVRGLPSELLDILDDMAASRSPGPAPANPPRLRRASDMP